MESLLATIDKERDARFLKPWSKLDKGSRLNRLSLYVRTEITERELTEEEGLALKHLLMQLCEAGALTKACEITYSEDEQQVTEIKRLTYEEETRVYSYAREDKTSKSSHKSRSNIDRHFSRSKESKR
jgi:hypothetical protein